MALARIVERVGLEDASELVALATSEQLLTVLDEDLWKSTTAGEDERFDAERFVTWLEVLLEAGDHVVAEKLAALPEDLLTLALHAHVLVIELDRLASEIGESEDGEQVDKALSNHLHEELDEMILVARHADGWDAILAALLALDKEHHSLLVRVLGRCAAIGEEEIEESGGLYEVLTSEASLEDDVAGDREDRRAAEGFVAPSSAKSFLRLARRPLPAGDYVRDVVTRGSLRDAARAAGRASASHALPPTRAAALLAELTRDEHAAEVEPRVAGALPRAGSRPIESVLAAAMRELEARAPARFAERSEELAYLANVLGAGCGWAGRRMRPVEAVQAALATTSLGLELASSTANAKSHVATLTEQPADALFRVAFHTLHEVVLRAGRCAVLLLERAASASMEQESVELRAAAAALARAIDTGEPWRERERIELLEGELDAPSVAALVGLVDELPSRTGALARGEGGAAAEAAGAASPKRFETASQLETARTWLASLERAS